MSGERQEWKELFERLARGEAELRGKRVEVGGKDGTRVERIESIEDFMRLPEEVQEALREELGTLLQEKSPLEKLNDTVNLMIDIERDISEREGKQIIVQRRIERRRATALEELRAGKGLGNNADERRIRMDAMLASDFELVKLEDAADELAKERQELEHALNAYKRVEAMLWRIIQTKTAESDHELRAIELMVSVKCASCSVGEEDEEDEGSQ